MKNPVPEVALPYVCGYFEILLDCMLQPPDGVTGAACSYIVEQTGTPSDLAHVIERLLFQRGFTEPRARKNQIGATGWMQLTARGFLVALELARQKRVDSAGSI